MNKQLTFSRQVKDELGSVSCDSRCCRNAEICASFFGAGRFQNRTVILSTAHFGAAARLGNLIRQQYQTEVKWQTGRELLNLTIDEPTLYQSICRDIGHLFGYDPDSGSTSSSKMTHLSDCCQRAILRALFLTCGSISEPSTAYHLELSIRNSIAAEKASQLLNLLSIKPGILKRHGYFVVYIKEGQHIADFLLLTGAHYSMMSFESLRVEKEMRNSVNRVVNCDSANTQRIANTAARQLELIRQIFESNEIGMLPADLQAAAQARLANPDLSLKELGEMMQPPLGKSGMNHRLKRLEKIITDLLLKRRNTGHGT